MTITFYYTFIQKKRYVWQYIWLIAAHLNNFECPFAFRIAHTFIYKFLYGFVKTNFGRNCAENVLGMKMIWFLLLLCFDCIKFLRFSLSSSLKANIVFIWRLLVMMCEKDYMKANLWMMKFIRNFMIITIGKSLIILCEKRKNSINVHC